MKSHVLVGLLVFLALPTPPARAARELDRLSFSYLLDPSHHLGFDDVRASAMESRWHPIKGVPDFGYTPARVWLRTQVGIPMHAESRYYLEVPQARLDRIALYVVDPAGHLQYMTTGLTLPVSKRPFPSGRTIIPIEVQPGATTQIYISAETYDALLFPTRFSPESRFLQHFWNRRLFLGAFFGALLFAGLIGAGFSLVLRSRLVAFYSLFIFAFVFTFLSTEGLTAELFWPETPWLIRRDIHVFTTAAFTFYILFAGKFVNARKLAPRLYRFMLLLVAISLARLPWLIIHPNSIGVRIGVRLLLTGSLCALLLGLIAWRKVEAGRYLLWGTLCFGTLITLYILSTDGTLEAGGVIEYAPHLAIVIEVLIFAMGLFRQMGRVMSQTHELKMTILRAEKMSVLGQMAGGIAHEINNPLAVIKLSAQVLEKELPRDRLSNGDLARVAERIDTTTTRISSVVRSVQTLARKSDDQAPEVVPFKSILDEVLDLCRERFKIHHITLRVSAVDPAIRLRCRAIDISQVLLNLLSNAFDAVEEAESRWIDLAVAERAGRLELAIADSGPGIPPTVRARMFDPFFTTKEVGKGNGLGLSISRCIVERHGGTIRLDAGAEHTRFVVCLPV